MSGQREMTMRHGLVLAVLLVGLGFMASVARAASAEIAWPMEAFKGDLENKPSLQNGFKHFVHYCLGCHSLKFQRYERTADDLGIPHDVAMEDLVFTDQKIGDLITTSMDPELAKNWFGAAPPDLTMVARVRGTEWIYNYLKTFYVDDSRPLGVNNKVYPNVGMPHALAELQGVQREACGAEPAGDEAHSCEKLAVDEGTGLYTAEEYDQAIYDITNFLYYVGDPSRLERQRTGVFVLLFLVILGCFTYLLNREFWKGIH
ncbi:MAG: cytochrome c1 [Pseudomonadota bacterium]